MSESFLSPLTGIMHSEYQSGPYTLSFFVVSWTLWATRAPRSSASKARAEGARSSHSHSEENMLFRLPSKGLDARTPQTVTLRRE